MSKHVQKDDEIHQNTLEIFKKCFFFPDDKAIPWIAASRSSDQKQAKRTSVHCTSYSDHAHCSQPMGENGVTKGNSRAGGLFFCSFS